MAEGYAQNTLCRYFMHGACRLGENCHFSHDREHARPSLVCQYYLKGSCSYGERCRYDHIRPNNVDNSRNAVNNNLSSRLTGVKITEANSPQSTSIKVAQSISEARSQPPPSKPSQSQPSTCDSRNQGFTTLTANIKNSKLCVDAPEFVPRSSPRIASVTSNISYAQAAGSDTLPSLPNQFVISNEADIPNDADRSAQPSLSELCPYYLVSYSCKLGNSCPYIHGLLCEVCQLACLHPNDESLRNAHIEECTKLMEAEMEHSFAVARSKEKVCGICMDTVLERSKPSERRFGILPNCNHCFCLDCIRKWRQSKQFENKIVRSCPECRTQSDYIIPSRYWVDDKENEEKERLLSSYRKALSSKACKYFNEGKGECPFGNKCFYLHALPDGTKKDVGPPKARKRFNAWGELQQYLEDNMAIWDYIVNARHRQIMWERVLERVTDDDTLSDFSDY